MSPDKSELIRRLQEEEVSEEQLKQIEEILNRREATHDALVKTSEVEEDPIQKLIDFQKNYENWNPSLKEDFTWEYIADRLTDHNFKYIKLAGKMEGGGVLFGVDSEGNPLIADNGEDLIMFETDYNSARSATKAAGYELFELSRSDYSRELNAFERFTGKRFSGKTTSAFSKGSWLESGENPNLAHIAHHNKTGDLRFKSKEPNYKERYLGVRRLLRVRAD